MGNPQAFIYQRFEDEMGHQINILIDVIVFNVIDIASLQKAVTKSIKENYDESNDTLTAIDHSRFQRSGIYYRFTGVDQEFTYLPDPE